MALHFLTNNAYVIDQILLDFVYVHRMRHRLHFEEEAQKTKVIDANVPDSDRYELSDPRNPMTQRRRENSKKAMRSKR